MTVIMDPTARLGAKRDLEVWTYDSDNSRRIKLGLEFNLKFYAHWLNLKMIQFTSNSDTMELPIWQGWFCSVGSPCIAEVIHWSQPSHTVEKLLFWFNSENLESAPSFCVKLSCILKTSSVTKRLQCLCCQPTIYHWFVDILPRYDLF